jgi:hypothetical protein
MQAQSSNPLWEIDLSKFGYQGRPPAAFQHLKSNALMRFGTWINQQGVTFSDSNVLVTYFVVHMTRPTPLKGGNRRRRIHFDWSPYS